MIQLKEVIQYYIGQRCVHAWYNEGHEQYDRTWVLTSIDYSTPNHYRIENPEDDFTWTDSIKPILRKLEDMTEEEATELATICYHSIYGNGKLTIQQIFESAHSDHFGASFRDDESDRVGFTVDIERGVELSVNSIKLNVNQFTTTIYLLKQGFDLFGLIERGEAVDQKTLNKEV